jgi:hypothetical protein
MLRANMVGDSLAARALIGETSPAAVPPIIFAASRRVIVAL